MSTKIAASIKSVSREADQTTITLVLEKPFHTTLKDEDVFIELHTLQGNKVEFHKLEVEEEEESISDESPDETEQKPRRSKKA